MIPIILSGGAGTRLWPVSRDALPKPFIRFGNGLSLLQRTVQRAAPLAEEGHVCIVTNEAYGFKTQEELEALRPLPRLQVTQLLEPLGRNTAPAIALAALWAQDVGADPVLLVLPADHLIPDEEAFVSAARTAAELAVSGEIVLFGIRPTSPETGFGYLELEAPLSIDGCFRVKRFVEKPDANRAIEFLQAGTFAWNSGMFCFRASTIVEALSRHAPEVLAAARQAWANARVRENAHSIARQMVSFSRADFEKFPDISVDYAVMERVGQVAAVRANFHWSDIGTWKAVSEQLPSDENGNTTLGETVLVGTRNTHVQSDGRLVAAVGVDNLLIIDTPDALLVAARDSGQQVKEIVGRLKAIGHETASLHRTVERPWGTYTLLNEGPRFKIKRIEVKTGQTLSLQMHHHRSEHWVVVSGTAKVTCGENVYLVSANESTYIPVGTQHRLENPGKVPLVMIEVQCGDYVGEDDIVRFEDVYGRVEGSK